MATLGETQALIEQKKQEIAQAKENVSKIKQAIPQTTQAQLRGQKTPSGLAGRDLQRKLKSSREQISQAEEQVSQYEQGLSEYESQFSAYQGTDSGKLAYAKENNLKPSSYISWRPYENYALVQIPVYTTPYGDIVDFEMQNELTQQAYATEKKFSETGIPTTQEFVSAQQFIGSDTSGLDVQKFLRGEQIKRGDITYERKGDSMFKTEIVKELPSQLDFVKANDTGSGIQARQNGWNFATGIAVVSASTGNIIKENNYPSSVVSKVKNLFIQDRVTPSQNVSITDISTNKTFQVPSNLFGSASTLPSANIPRAETGNKYQPATYQEIKPFGGLVKPVASAIFYGGAYAGEKVVQGTGFLLDKSTPYLKDYASNKINEIKRDIFISKAIIDKTSPYVSSTGRSIGNFAQERINEKIDRTKRNIAIASYGIKKGYEASKPYVNIFTGEVVKASNVIGKLTKEEIKRGYEQEKQRVELIKAGIVIASPYIKEGKKLAVDYLVQSNKPLVNSLFFAGKESYPYVAKYGGEALNQIGTFGADVGKSIYGGVSGTFDLGKDIYFTSKPYVKNAIKQRLDRYKPLTLFGESLINQSKPYVKEKVSQAFNILKPSLKQINIGSDNRFGFNLPKFIIQQEQGRKYGFPTQSFMGLDVPISPADTLAYRTGEGITNWFGAGYTQIYKDLDYRKEETYFKPSGWMGGIGYDVVTITKESKQAEAEAFGNRVKTAVDIGTYLTPIATYKIAGGLGEATIKGEAGKFITKNPWDVVFLGLSGASSIKYFGSPAGRKALSIYKNDMFNTPLSKFKGWDGNLNKLNIFPQLSKKGQVFYNFDSGSEGVFKFAKKRNILSETEKPTSTMEDFVYTIEKQYFKEGEKGAESILKQLAEKITQEKDIVKKGIAIENYNRIVNELMSRDIIKGAVTNFETGKVKLGDTSVLFARGFRQPSFNNNIISFETGRVNNPKVINPSSKSFEMFLLASAKVDTSLIFKDNLNVNKPTTKEKASLGSLNVLSQIKLNATQTKTKQTQQPKQDVLNLSALGSLSGLKSNQVTQQKTQQRTKQITKQVFRTETLTKTIKKGTTGIFNIPSNSKNKIVKIIEDNFGGFEAFGKRFGKDLSLGKFGTKKEAEGKITSFLKNTLGASAFLEQGGKKVSSQTLSLMQSPEFRQSKKDISRIIQVEKYRLQKADAQTKEINLFKKRALINNFVSDKNKKQKYPNLVFKNRNILKPSKIETKPRQNVYGDESIFFNSKVKGKTKEQRKKDLLLGFTDF